MAAWSAPESPSALSLGSPCSKPPLMVMVEVSPGEPEPLGAAGAGFSEAPQLLQNRASSALLCPHCVQLGIGAPPRHGVAVG
jgi:hypothetical protein